MSHASRFEALLLVLVLSVLPAIGGGQESSWSAMASPAAPSARAGHAMVYDAGSDRIILFGGELAPLFSGVLTDETWAFDLNSDAWTNLNPSPRPSPRFLHAMAYDAGSNRVILFGGWTDTGRNAETWAYDFATNTWTNMAPAIAPSARVYVQMTYDAESDRIILFGGGGHPTFCCPLDDTWAYDFDTNSWEPLNPGTAPSPRQVFGQMAYDTESDRIVLFGGENAPIQYLADTWEYDYNSDRWTETSPETGPTVRAGGAMTYHASMDKVVLFGGARVFSAETWVYDLDSDTWTLAIRGAGPSSRFGTAMVYDTDSQRIVLFGGSSRGNETWTYDLETNTWTPVGRTDGPAGLPPWMLPVLAVSAAGVSIAIAVILWRRRKGRQTPPPPD